MVVSRQQQPYHDIHGSDNSSRGGLFDSCMGGWFQPRQSSVAGASAISTKRAPDDTDSFLARELNQLSIEERSKALEEVHGIPQVLNEDPEELEKQFEIMEKELTENIKDKKAYDRALFLSPKYVKDRSFRLLFLRAELLDGKKAAIKMVNHFQYKLELFGVEKLVKDIELEDLDEADREALMTGHFYILPHKDRGGRSILFSSVGNLDFRSVENEFRANWFVLNKALREDDDMSRLGVVYCSLNMMKGIDLSKKIVDVVTKSGRLIDCTPFRFASIQYCYDSPLIRPLIGMAAMVISRYSLVRFNPHYGSQMECLWELMRFGIPREIIPLDEDSNIILDDFRAMIERCEERAASTPDNDGSSQTIPYPKTTDVLLGRGVPYQDFFGNVQLMESVDLYMLEYQTANERGRKGEICKEIVQQVQERGGRFIRRTRTEDGEGDEWEEVSQKEALEKLGHLFRNRSKKVLIGAEREIKTFANFWDYRSSSAPNPDAVSSRSKRRRTSWVRDGSSSISEDS